MPKIVDHHARRASIARAAADAVAELGLDRVRLVDVARRAGCTTGAVSHYFPDKDAVLVAALEHVLGSLGDLPRGAVDLLEAHGIERGSEAASRALVETLAEILPLDDERRAEWRIWLGFCGRAAHQPELAALHRDAYRRLQAALVEGLAALGLPRGATADEDVAACLMAAVDGIGLRAALEPDDWPATRQRTLLAAQVLPFLQPVRSAGTDALSAEESHP